MVSNLKLHEVLIASLVISSLVGCSQRAVQQEAEVAQIVPAAMTEAEPEIDNSIVDQHEFQQGLDALSVRDDETAKQIFERFIQKNPGLSGAYINLAWIAYRRSDFTDSQRLIDQVLAINQQSAEAYHLQALLYQQKDAIRQAEEAYKIAIRLKPDYVNAHYNLALLYDIFLQDLPLAIKHYSKYLEMLDRDDKETRDWVKHLQTSLAKG